MDKEAATKVLIETALAYLMTNADEGVLEPDEKARIVTAIETLK